MWFMGCFLSLMKVKIWEWKFMKNCVYKSVIWSLVAVRQSKWFFRQNEDWAVIVNYLRKNISMWSVQNSNIKKDPVGDIVDGCIEKF